MVETKAELFWERFTSFIAARDSFKVRPCIYVQTTPTGEAVHVGKASKGLEARYRGGTGHALNAAMHDSGNLVFVAEVPYEQCAAIEDSLIWTHRAILHYNQNGKKKAPRHLMEIAHTGDGPRWTAATQTKA